MHTRTLSLMAGLTLMILFAPGAAQAEVVKATPGGRVGYDGGMTLEFGGDCWGNIGEIEVHQVIDGLQCYRQSFDVAATSWRAPDGLIHDSPDCNEPPVTENPQIGIYDGSTVYMRGFNYWGHHLNCPRGEVKELFEEKRFTFEVFQSCPRTLGVRYVEGKVSVDGKPVGDAERIDAKTEISTGKNGRIEFELNDGTVLRLGPNSKMKLDCSKGPELPLNFKVKLIMGEIWHQVTKTFGEGRNFETETPHSRAGVRGTTYEVIERGNESRIIVEEGLVEFGRFPGDPDAIMVGECQAARIREDGKPERIPPFNTEMIFCAPEE